MDRVIQHNVIAMSGRAVEAAGDVNTLLLDKTGTITLGNRQAVEFIPAARRHRPTSWPTAAQLASLARRDAGGAQHRGAGQGEVQPARPAGERGRQHQQLTFIPFSAATRMSGVDIGRRPAPQGRGRRGRAAGCARTGGRRPGRARRAVERIARAGGTPLVVAEQRRRDARRWA